MPGLFDGEATETTVTSEGFLEAFLLAAAVDFCVVLLLLRPPRLVRGLGAAFDDVVGVVFLVVDFWAADTGCWDLRREVAFEEGVFLFLPEEGME